MKNLSICLISFINFLINLFFISMFLFFLSIYFIMYDYILFIEWKVISFNSLNIVMTLLFDWMSLIFMSFVLFISSLVICYSKGYMEMDYNINRFMMLVLMFVSSMMLLIISPNLVSILLGWDGLGLVSYCLVIYFQNIKSYNAGMLTALSNRIGDVALLLAIAWMLNYGSWNYVFYLDFMKNSLEIMIIGGLVMLAAMTKSAQIPFSSWLPATMAAPTPVSALVHSSTLVTAGVYLLIRFNILLSTSWMGILLLNNIYISNSSKLWIWFKKNYCFINSKTISFNNNMGYYKLAFFHLLTHALFKALLYTESQQFCPSLD